MISFVVRRLDETASTNDDARRAAEQGAPEGTVIWALSQTLGRGRHGRQWASPVGNLYCSVVLRPPGGLQTYGHYSFIAALALTDTIRVLLPDAQVELKWPNDVLVGCRKISGILLESGPDFLILGMGLNVLHIPENPLYPATSLAAENISSPPLETILNNLLQKLNHWCARYRTHSFAPIRDAWLACARQGDMRIRLPDGDLHGQFADLDMQGNLHLRLSDGTTRSIHTGDVFF